MIRLLIVLLIGGIALCIQGCNLMVASMRSGSEPTEMELSALESGGKPATPFVRIGKHLAVIEKGVVDPSAGTVYYPVISLEGLGGLQQLERGLPVDGLLPRAKVIIQAKDSNALPAMQLVDSTTGMVRQYGKDLHYQARNLLKKGLGRRTVDDMLVLEKDAQPSVFWGGLTIAGGVLLIVAGCVVFVGFAKDR